MSASQMVHEARQAATSAFIAAAPPDACVCGHGRDRHPARGDWPCRAEECTCVEFVEKSER